MYKIYKVFIILLFILHIYYPAIPSNNTTIGGYDKKVCATALQTLLLSLSIQAQQLNKKQEKFLQYFINTVGIIGAFIQTEKIRPIIVTEDSLKWPAVANNSVKDMLVKWTK